MKCVILLSFSYVCFFTFSLSAMDREVSYLDLTTTNDQKVTFFADYTESTSLSSVDITVTSNHKNIELKQLLVDRNGNRETTSNIMQFTLGEPLPLNKCPIGFIKYADTIYRINKIDFLADKIKSRGNNDSTKLPLSPRWDALPSKLFVTSAFLICIFALLRYLNFNNMHTMVG